MLALLLWLLSSVVAVVSQCPDHAFLGCVLRLKAQRVPLERNIMTLVFGIKNEAELLHTCRAYSSNLPCFRQKINECGDEKQKRLINDVGNMLMYMCTPFSLTRQRTLIANQKCVSDVLSMPATTGCKLQDMDEGDQVLKCKKYCAAKQMDFLCTMKAWISEQNVCTVKDIQDQCGAAASDFYREMQRVVFEPEFPVICEYGNETSAESNAMPTSTANTILIESPPTTAVAEIRTTLPAAYFNQSYPERKFVVTVTPPSLTTSKAAVWTKSPVVKKVQYNKESWRKKAPKATENMVVVPSFISSTSRTVPLSTLKPVASSSPRSYKVINLLKSLLPDNLPDQLTSLLENSLEKHAFTPEDHYHTPGAGSESVATTVTDGTTTSSSTATATKALTIMGGYHLGARRKPTTKWKPWYLGGPAE